MPLLTSLWLRLQAWTLVDVFLLSIALYFGAYTIVDVLSIEESNVDPVVVAAVFTLVASGAFVLWLAAHMGAFPETSLTALQRDWRACHPAPIIGLIALAIGFRWYTFVVFSEFDALGEQDPVAFEQYLPYWYTSIGMIVSATIFGAGICAWGKVRAARGWQRLFWLAITAVSALLVFGMGRRAILAMLIVMGWTLFAAQHGKRSRWLTLTLLALAIPVVTALSNVYQAYRLVSYRGVPLENMIAAAHIGSFFEEAAAVDRTLADLKERQPAWRFNYEVVSSHSAGPATLQWGELLVGELPNYIPAPLYPGKEWRGSEDILLQRFGLENYDRASNVFAYTYADFGWLSAVVAPALVLFWCWLFAAALRVLADAFLRVLLMGMAIFWALNLETVYLAPVGLARDFAIVAIAYLAARTTARALRFLLAVRPQIARPS